MAKKLPHPDRLFDYLNGALEEAAAQAIEGHVSSCNECASIAKLCRALKASDLERNRKADSQVLERTYPTSGDHPDVNELASFFYLSTRSESGSSVAAHVARCGSCCEAIAEYARAERAAAAYQPAKEAAGEAPAKAWEMIRDWEDSSFATLKPASEVLGQELLTRLARALNERTRDALDSGGEASRSQHADQPESAERIPVLIVSRSGEIRSVELFEQVVEATGARVLRHAEGSDRFDNRLVHALLNPGEPDSFVISEMIRSDTLRLEPAPRGGEPIRRVHYFIVEDSND